MIFREYTKEGDDLRAAISLLLFEVPLHALGPGLLSNFRSRRSGPHPFGEPESWRNRVGAWPTKNRNPH